MKNRTTEPSMNDILDSLKAEIFRDLNCVKQGELQDYDPTTATCTVKIKIKEFIDKDTDLSVSYPILADVPVMILQGGGSWIEFPIAKGDPCLLFFSDRDIDTWWSSGNETTPNTQRRHSLSDAVALVGINPKSAALALTGKLRLFGGPHKMDFVNDAQGMADLMASLFSNIDTLFGNLSNLITAIKGIVTLPDGSGGGLNPASIAALTAHDAALTTTKGNFDTVKTNFTQLLGVSS